MKIIAHRGYRAKFPENTVLAFKKAMEYGADGIELDVRMSLDKKLVIVHDPFIVDKLNLENAYIISETPLEDLKKIPLGMKQSIPTLKEILENLNNETFIDVEFKIPEVIEPSIELLEFFGFKNLMFSSFKRGILKDLKNEFPSALIGLLYEVYELEEIDELFDSLVNDVKKYDADSLNLPIDFFRGRDHLIGMLKKVRDLGIKIAFWTVNNMIDFDSIDDVTDFLITDEIEKMMNRKEIC